LIFLVAYNSIKKKLKAMKRHFADNPRIDTQIRLVVMGIGIVVGVALWLTTLLGFIQF
jgi:hypothetical protein